MNFGILPELKKHGRGEVVIFFVTMGTIVFVNLLTGVVLGLVLALRNFCTRRRIWKRFMRIIRVRKADAHLQGIATFVSLPRLAATLEIAPPHAEIHLDCIAAAHRSRLPESAPKLATAA